MSGDIFFLVPVELGLAPLIHAARRYPSRVWEKYHD